MVYENFILELWYLYYTLTLVLVLWSEKLFHLFQTTQDHGG